MKNIKSIKEFDTILKQAKPVIIDFYADWCPPCRAQLPILEKFDQSKGSDAEVIKIDVDKHPEIAQRYGVRSIPTIVLSQVGETVYQKAGLHSYNELSDLVENLAVSIS